MKTIFFALALIITNFSFGQTFFEETFPYGDYTAFQAANPYPANPPSTWTFFNNEPCFDYNDINGIEPIECIKSNSIETIAGRSSLKCEFDRLDDDIVNYIIGLPYSDYILRYNKFARNEIATWNDPNITSFKADEEYWYKYSIYIPNDFEFEKFGMKGYNDRVTLSSIKTENIDILGQIHGDNSTGAVQHPPISIQIVKGQWYLVTYPNDLLHPEAIYYLGPVVTGVWVDWKLNVIFSKETDGKIRLWKDGVSMVSLMDVKTVNVESTFYFQMGFYKANWWKPNIITTTNTRIAYFSDVSFYRNIGLIDEDCGKVLNHSDMSITTKSSPVPTYPSYHFRIDNNPNTTNHIDTNSETINLRNYSWIEPNTTYFTKVKVNGQPWFDNGEYAEEGCVITTPNRLATMLIEEDCGRYLTSNNMSITTHTVYGSPSPTYHFRFDSPGLVSRHVQSANPTINLNNYGWVQPNRKYYVAVKIDNYTYSKYGEYADISCEIFTPPTIPGNNKNSISTIKDKDNSLIAFPNPIKDNRLNLKLDSDEKIIFAELKSIDNNLDIPLVINSTSIEILNEIKQGIYILHVVSDKNSYKIKLLK